MKCTATLSGKLQKSIFILISCIAITLFSLKSYGQARTYATIVTKGNQANSHVTNANNAISTSETSFARVNSDAGGALGLGSFQGEIELTFPQPIDAGVTTFLRINAANPDLLNTLLGGSLGKLLANVLGSVVLGNRFFEAGARMGSNLIIKRDGNSGFNTDQVKLIKDAQGFFYLAITPDKKYDRVYLKDYTVALLGLGVSSGYTDVYYAFTGTSADQCSQAFATSYDGTGISLDLLKLGGTDGAGVRNAQNLIDSDPNNFSTLSLGLISVAGSISQDVYFATPSRADDDFSIKLKVDPALVNVGLLNNISVIGYKDGVAVGSTSLSSLLGLDLLGLFNSGAIVSVPISPGVAIDRVKVQVSSLLNVSIPQGIQLYGITRSAGKPAVAQTAFTICGGTQASLTATTANVNELRWYDVATGGTGTTTAYNAAFLTPALTTTKTYYVAARRVGCTDESERVPIVITVNPGLTFATTTLNDGALTFAYSKQINLATGGTGAITYAVASGTTIPAGLNLSASGLITGKPTATGTFTFSITASDTKGCNATAIYTLKVNGALTLATATLPNGTVGVLYPVQTIPAAIGGTGPYTYEATNLPPGVTFDKDTRTIVGTPNTAGTYTIPVTVTDLNGNTVTTDYTIIIRDPFVLPAATLVNGVVGTPYPTQTIPAATGGNSPYIYSATGLPAGLSFDPDTRQITGTPTTAGTSTVSVTAQDGDGKTITTTYTLKVTDPLVLATATLPEGTVGAVYPTQTIPAATGGTGPYTYAAVNTPVGLTFNPATRTITGTPTQSGSNNIVVTATDADGKTISQTYVLKVNGVLVLPAANLAAATVGTPYTSAALPAVSGGTSPYTYNATGLPAGLTFNSTTRVISGTSTVGGPFTVTLTAKDVNGLTTSTDYALNVTVPAPAVAGTITCAGTTATLAVTTPITGVTYNWYAASGNTSIATGTSFTTPALSATTTYYVEAVSGAGVSATRTAVTVTVNPAPALPTVLTRTESISAGQTATLQASADAGVTVKWFAAATGGPALATGENFTTPILSTTTTYYVGTESSLGCASTSRVAVTVTVTTGPANPTCNVASTQKSGVDGICLLCGVSNPGNAIDGNPNTFTRLTVAVGVGASVYQQLGFANAGTAADFIRLELASPVGLADVTVLGGITVSVYNGTTLVKSYPLNSNLLNLQLLSGNKFTATVPATGAFNRVEVRYGALVSALTSLDIYSATVIYPTPTIATTGQAICAGSTTTLTATPNGGTTLKWYGSATSGTVLATGNTYSTPALTATTTYYIEVSKGTCANPERVPVTVTVNPVINFATTTLPNASLTFTYGKQINVATGGTPAFKYALASGSSLPLGLALSESGSITGTPTASGDFSFSIIATDSKGCTATATYTLKVTAAVSLPVATLPNGTVGTVYPTQTIPAAIGGTGPYTYAAINVPDGLTFNPATRTITGTPTTAGTYTIPVTVTDANGNKASRDYTIIVRDPLVLPTATLADGTVGTPYPTQTIPAATGGATPVTYTATGLPVGLSFDPDTRQITGTPTTAGTSTVTVVAKDADGKTVTNTYTIKVLDPLVLAAAILPDGTAGTVYPTQTIPAATGGTGPYTYAAVNVPNGLNFDPATRTITGTPTQSGSNNIVVTVTDAAGKKATQTYVLKVNGVLVLPAATLANGTVGSPYTSVALPAVTGGTSPYTYTATGLPAGLTFNETTRVISGTPTIGGPFTVTVTAKDNAGLTTSTDYALNITVAAPAVAATTTCGGTTATLAVTTPITGVTYKWYAATGNIPVAEGATFTTPALTANTTYYVEAVSGTVASTRTAVTVTVNPSPALATIQTANESISAGQTVTLRANADAGVTIKWFAASTGGAALATGNNFTTPTLSATTTYYVGTESALGCASSSRVPVTVTVTSAPANPTCNIASTQKSGVDGICVLCGVSNPGNAIDGNPNTFTRLTVALGVGASVYQQLGFASQGSAADNIRLELASPVGIADVTVLGGITVSVYNGTTLVKSYPLSSNLLNLQVLSGNKFTATVPATGIYDRIEIRYGALVSALTSLDIYSATAIYAAPTVATTGLAICAGTATTLTATPNGGTTLKWYASANSATVLATGNTFTTPALTATTTYYIEVSKGTCANAERIPVTVTVNPVINFATTTLANATLLSAYSKQINVATGGTPAFKYALVSGNSLPAGLTLSETGVISGTPTVSGDFTFSIVATDSKGCNAIAAYTLKVTDALSLPVATLPNGTVGATYPVQTLPAAIGGTTPYTYAVPVASLPPGLTFDPATRKISGVPTKIGTYVIPMTATDANGNKVSADYTIIVRDPLLLPAATLADGTVGTPYQTQTIPAATGGNSPYTYTATGLPDGLSFNPATREITGTPTKIGTSTVSVTAKDGDGKTVTTNYVIKVNDPLVLPAKLLANGTVGVVYVTETIPAATGGTGSYTYVATNVPLGLTFNPATRTITGTPTQSGSNNISVTVTDAAGKTATQTYVLKVNGVLVLPPATLANGTVGSPYTSAALPAVTGGTSPYTYTATGLPAGLSFNETTRVITGAPTVGGPFTVTVTAKDATGLTTSTDYALNVVVGAPVVAGTTTCAGTTATLAVTTPITGVTYKWYASTGNTSIFEGTSFTTPALSANTTYYVEAVSGAAVSATRTAVTVTVNPSPALATVLTKNESISAGQTATLQASADAGVIVKWFAAASGGAALATGNNFTTPTLSATTTYYVGTESALGCASSSRVPVTVTVTSGPANPNCNVASTQKSGVDGICVLCGVSNPGNAIDGNPNTFTRLTVALGVGASVYQQLGFANAGTAADFIRLELASPVGLADVTVLGGITVSVFNGSTLVKSYPLNSNLLNLQVLSGNKFTATVPATGAFDRVEVRYGALVSALTSLDIYSATVIYAAPTIATAGQSVCAGSTTTLTATANGGTTLKWYASANSATVLATGNTFTTPALTANTTYYIEVSRGTCSNPERVPVTVTVTPVPTAPVVAAVAPVCSGSTAVLSVTAPASGVVYSWYSLASGGTALATGTTFTTPALTANTTYYVGAATGTCASSTRTAVNVTVNTLPVLATVTTNDANISAGQTATLEATAPAGTTIKWYAAPTNGTALATGTTFTTPTLTATTTYYVETSNASGCVSATRVAVTVTVTGGPVNPNCNAANSQQSGIEGICVLCSVQNPGNSVDNNFSNFTTISLPVGVGGSGYQRLIFPNSGVATDSVRLDLELPTGLADVSILGGIKVTIMNGTTVVKTYNLNSSLLYLQLLGGSGRFKATLPATGVYDRVEVRAQGLVSALINLRVYGAEVIYPNPAVSVDGQTICAGSATKLSAAAKGGTTLRWYSAATGGTLLQTGENFTTPVLTATTTYYIEVSKGTCANVTRVPVTVTVTTAPAAPVVATVAPVCPGSAAVISVTAPVAGTSYKWYTVATAGAPVFTGPVFTTPVLAANTTYYVEAANGTCVSATRTPVNVTVNPVVALPQVQASATTVNAGQTAILTATSADANVTFNWYTSAAGITPVFTGATYVTPPLTVTTTYYVEAKSTTGCISASRTLVTITVNGGGSPNPVPCEAPTTQEKGVVGVALLADVYNPQLAVDNDTKTGSSLVMPVGLLGASVYQRVIFTSLSNVGDTARVLLSAPGKLLSLGILSNISVSTYNGTTSNNDSKVINSNPLIRIELLSGNSEALVSFVPTQRFDKIEVRLNSGVAGLLTTVDLNYAQRVAVAPEVTAENVAACIGTPAVLSVKNPIAGIIYKWYNAAGVFQANGTSFTTGAINTATRFFVEANTASGCTSYRTPVNVTVTPAPLAPVLVNPVINSCAGNTVTITVSNPVTGVTYKWYTSSGIYIPLQDGPTFTTIVGAVATSFSVEAVTSCGTSAKTTATIEVGTLNKPVVTPASVTVSSGSPAVLTATSSTAGAIFKWYDSPVSNTVLFTGARYVTDPLVNNTGLATTRTFYVTAEITGAGACAASARASVDVTILPNANPVDAPCEVASVNVRTGVDGIALLTGVFNPQFAVDNNAASASSFVMPVGALGASVYQVVGFNGLSNLGDTVRLRISSPGKLLSLAVLPSIEVTTFNNGTSNNDMLLASNPIIHLELLSDNSGAFITFVPQKQFNQVELRLRSGLVAALTTLDFNYAQRIIAAPAVQAVTATACAGTSANLFVQNPVNGLTYRWYRGTTYLSGKDGVSLATDPTLAAGTYDFFVSATRNGCESAKTKVTVTILASPDAPVAAVGNPKVTCPNVPVTLAVNPVVGVTFKWYDALTGGTLLANNTNTYTTPANLSVGDHDFYVEAVNGNSCVGAAARTKITVTVNPSAIAADVTVAGANAPFCTGTKAVLTASTSTVTAPIFNWYSDAALTKLVFSGVTFTTPELTASTTYYVTVSGTNKCENTAAGAKAVVLNLNPPATDADLSVAGAATPFCAGAKVVLTATTNTVTAPVFNWYSDKALTTLVFTGDVFTINSITATTTYYVTVEGSNKCKNLAADAEVVTVTVNPPAIASDISVAGATTPFCKGSKAVLTASSGTVTAPVFTWYSDADLTTAVYTGTTFTTPELTATTKYYVTVRGNNKCENTAATAQVVTLTVNPPATAADISVTGADAPFCAGTKATLIATTSTVTNPIFTWYSDAALTTAVFTGATFVTPVLTATKTYYVTVKGSNRCENTGASASVIVVTVNPPAIATDISVAIEGAPFCAGTSARLTATTTTVTNPIFTWYSDAALTTAVFTGPVFDTPALTASKTYYVTVKGSNRCENAVGAAKVVTLTVNPPATAADIIIAGTGTPFCFGTKATLKATSTTVINPVFTWYTDAALTNAIFTGAEFVTPALTVNTTYYVTVRGANRCDNLAANARVVTLTVNTPATAADLTVTGGGTPFCAGTKATLIATTTTVNAPVFTWYSDAALTTAVFTGSTFITPALTVTTTYYVTVTGSNKCENTSATAKVITLIVNPPAVAGDINVAGNDAAFCAGVKATLKASSNTVTNPIFTWYTDAALTNAVFTGAEFETPVLTATRTYYVTVTGSNKCANLAANAKVVTVTVNPPATAADLTVTGNDIAFCAGAKATLTAGTTTVDNPIFTWYSDAALTTAVFTGSVFETPVLTATTTYYVTVRGTNKCDNTAANAKIVTVRVNPPATSADIIVDGANTAYCIGTKATLKATSTTVTAPIFTWYSDAALTTAVFTGPEFVTPVLNVTTTYYVTVRGTNKCDNLAASAKVVTVNVNTPATAADITVTGNTTSLCAGSKATLTAASATVTAPIFTWYSDADLTVVAYRGANFVTPVLTATTTYYVTVSGSNKCENTAATAKAVVVTVNQPAVAGDITVTGDQTSFCAGAKALLKATSTTVTNPIFTWYTDAALTNVAFTGADFETPVLTATRTYYVTVTGSNKCANLAANAKVVTVTVNPPATAADLTVTGADAAFCAGTKATLTATSATVDNPIFTWYSNAALTTVAFTGPVFETPVLTANTTYYVTVRGTNKCENVSGGEKVITVKVNPPAVAADIAVSGAGAPFCAGATAVLTATSNTVLNPVFTWYSDAALTDAVFTGAVLNVPSLTTTTTYYVTVAGTNKCANTAATAKAVTVTVNPTPEVPVVATAGTTICSGEMTTLTVQNAQANVSYRWYSAATGGTLLFTGSSYNTTALNSSTDFYVLAVNASGCENATGRVKVTVTVSPKPIVPSVLSTNVTVCTGSRAVLSVSNPQTGITYNWFTTAVGGTSIATGVNFNTPAISTQTIYYVEASNASCVNSTRIPVTVNPGVIPVAPASVSGAANPLCAGTTAVLTVNNPDGATTYRWYTAQTGGTSVAEGVSFTTPGLSSTTTYYVESVNTASGCASVQRTAVVVTILPRLSPPVVSTQSVTATSITFTWGAVAGAKAYEVSLDNGVSWMAPSSGATGTTHLVKDLKPDQSVSIRVRAIGQLDCQLSDVSTFTAKSDNPFGNQVFIPNTFTPNNDGKNDVLYVYATTIAKMKLRIYNQWGQFLYESQNIQNGWDGTYKGTLQPNGVYVYLLEAEFNDGTKTTKKGTVTLLR